MKIYENLWKSMNAMKINKNHANSLEVNGDQLSRVEFTVYWYSLGVLLVSFRSKPKVLQPANPPASQPANPPTRQPASQPANHLGPVFFTRKTYLFHRSGGESGPDLPKRTLSNVVFCNKYNEILLFWPCAGRAGPGTPIMLSTECIVCNVLFNLKYNTAMLHGRKGDPGTHP